MPSYKHIFTITRQLYRQRFPDDLVPIVFDYLGEPTETERHLQNKHCFYKITYFHPQNARREMFGHYCSMCDKMYLMKTRAQIRKHIRSQNHQRCLKKDKPVTPSRDRIVDLFQDKHFRFYLWSLEEQEFVSDGVFYKKIKFS